MTRGPEYDPSTPVTANALPSASTVAPGIGAPDTLSVTVPETLAPWTPPMLPAMAAQNPPEPPLPPISAR